jgi:hypothetical protein
MNKDLEGDVFGLFQIMTQHSPDNCERPKDRSGNNQ